MDLMGPHGSVGVPSHSGIEPRGGQDDLDAAVVC